MADEEESPFVTAMKQRWEFLAPWWTALKPCIEYTYPETENMEEYVWDVPDIVLKVTMPTRRDSSKDEETFRRDFQKLQEALALITAVEHADYHAYDYILTKHCGIVRGRYGEELNEVMIDTRFLLDLDMASHENQTDDGAITYDLVRFCGTHQREHPSEEYLTALGQIAALDENLKPGEAGVDIRIPIKLQFETFMRGMHDLASGNYAEVLEGIAKAEKEIEMQWAAYAGNAEEKKLMSGTLRCAFVLEPMLADFTGLATGRAFISMSQRNAKAVENLMLNNLWFSLLEIDLSIERTDADHELEARKSIGLLLRSLLDSKSRTREDAHISYHFDCPPTIQVSQLQAFKLMCDATMPAKDFEAMCSALVLARTTKKLALELEISSWDHNNRANWWKWLAYGLFSKRAHACSSLRTLIIPDVGRLTAADVHAFNSVLTSEHPEEMLCGTPRGLTEERDATLARGAPIRWDFDEEGRPVLNSRLLTLDTPIEFVRTFSDDGKSEWVDVLIAGFGRCQVQRSDLEFYGETCARRHPKGIKSLKIIFQGNNASNLAIVPFLESIGSSLTALTLDGPRSIGSGRMDENAIIQSCPNLLKLTLVRELIEVQLDFREYRAAKTPIPKLTFAWSDVPKFAGYLSDPHNPLTKCVRRLKFSLLRCCVPVADLRSGNAPSFPYYVNAVVRMLEKNERLEYLSVDSPYIRFVSDIKRFHRKPIHRQRKPLQRKCMLAFLSVLEPRASTEPTKKKKKLEKFKAVVGEIDQHVVVNIFSFAAPPVLREVYFESPQRVVFDDDPQGQRRVQGRHGQFLQDQQAQLAPPALHGEQEQGN